MKCCYRFKLPKFSNDNKLGIAAGQLKNVTSLMDDPQYFVLIKKNAILWQKIIITAVLGFVVVINTFTYICNLFILKYESLATKNKSYFWKQDDIFIYSSFFCCQHTIFPFTTIIITNFHIVWQLTYNTFHHAPSRHSNTYPLEKSQKLFIII